MKDGIYDIMKTHYNNTLKAKKEWAEKYPNCLSVYVCNGKPGDRLWIGDKEYVLVNEFLAATYDTVLSIEEAK